MMDRRCPLIVLPLIVWVALAPRPATAGFLFGKKTKPTPAEYVPELIKTLKTDGDEHKRSSAAEELRQYDPAQFPDMVPALVDALMNDKKPGVRAEAAQSLGKLRPVNTAAGLALEQAQAKDGSMRVRLQARSSLLQYRWAGYPLKGKEESQPPAQSKEPPLAPEPPATVAAPTAAPAPRLTPVPAATTSLPSSPRPLPVGTPVKRSVPVPAPAPVPAAGPPLAATATPPSTPFSLGKTTKTPEETGPELTPP
jgi:hypothetical protein